MKVNAVESFFFKFFYSNHKISVCLSQTHMYNEAHVSTCFYVLENLKQQQLGRAKWNSVFSKTTCIYFYLSFLYINGYRTEHVVYVLYDIGFRSARSNLMPSPLLFVKIIFFSRFCLFHFAVILVTTDALLLRIHLFSNSCVSILLLYKFVDPNMLPYISLSIYVENIVKST